ncbi:MAG: hypothetical protein ACREM2_05440 [Vulcanimicrobiaceae bacterium]
MSASVAPDPTPERPAVVIDLIGDLDATLGSLVAETLAVSRAATVGSEIVLAVRYIVGLERDGLAQIARGLAAARARGADISVYVSQRRFRLAFRLAGIACNGRLPALTGPSVRHVMMARHAATAPLGARSKPLRRRALRADFQPA